MPIHDPTPAEEDIVRAAGVQQVADVLTRLLGDPAAAAEAAGPLYDERVQVQYVALCVVARAATPADLERVVRVAIA